MRMKVFIVFWSMGFGLLIGWWSCYEWKNEIGKKVLGAFVTSNESVDQVDEQTTKLVAELRFWSKKNEEYPGHVDVLVRLAKIFRKMEMIDEYQQVCERLKQGVVSSPEYKLVCVD